MTMRHQMLRASPSVSRSLLAVCHATWPSTDLTASEKEEFVAAARLHRIAPMAYVVARGVADEVADRFRVDRDRAMAMTLRTTLTLDFLTRTLSGLPWLTFKGLVLSMNAHPVPGLRTFSDLDVLIDPNQLRAASDRLRADGWQPLDYDDMLSSAEPPGEIHWLSPHGLKLDLHWSMINSAFRRDMFDVRTDELLSRRVTAVVGLTSVPTLDPEDTLVHTCLHAALDGAARLLQLVDVDGCARHILSWESLAERARRWQAAAQVWVVLSRAKAALGTPLPEDLSDMLGIGAPLRASLSIVDRIAPVASVRESHGLTRFAARAVRPTLRSTLAVGARNARLGVVERVRHDDSTDRHRVPASESTTEKFVASVEATVRADH